MSKLTAAAIDVGLDLPALRTGKISRAMIAGYAAGSGDLNPLHTDIDFARSVAGLPDVIVHGMFSMGYLGRVVAEWAGPTAVRALETRFEAMVNVYDDLTCTGRVTAIATNDEGVDATVELSATKADGTRVASGSATVFIPRS